jgi:two-component system response regulator CpxR
MPGRGKVRVKLRQVDYQGVTVDVVAPNIPAMNQVAVSQPRIVLVDDDRELTSMLIEYLTHEGFVVTAINDGGIAHDRLGNRDYRATVDLLVLDVMLPGRSGLDILRALHGEDHAPPVIMLTARGDDVDRIVGLELGADDYLAKPFNPRELVARIRAILRRRSDVPTPQKIIAAGSWRLDPARHRVTVRGVPVALTGAELRVLEVLMRSIGSVVTREHLTEQALGRKLELYDRSIDTHVSNVRRKLGPAVIGDPEIRGIRGAGYLLVLPDEQQTT